MRPLSESDYCGDTGDDCISLERLGRGCSGSHTEQVCDSCRGGFVRVGGNDDVELYYDDKGRLAGLKRNDLSLSDCEAWFGIDLSDCVAVEEERSIGCRP